MLVSYLITSLNQSHLIYFGMYRRFTIVNGGLLRILNKINKIKEAKQVYCRQNILFLFSFFFYLVTFILLSVLFLSIFHLDKG